MPEENNDARDVQKTYRKRKAVKSDFFSNPARNTNESEVERDILQTPALPVACPQPEQSTGSSSGELSKRRKYDPGKDDETEASSSEQIPAGVWQRWDPVIRFFVPPDESWMDAICAKLGISRDVKRPPYGHRKQFDGLSSQPCRRLPIRGDGHCGFRCISVMLTGSQNHYSLIRQRVAEFVVEHASEGWLSPHLPFPFYVSPYLNRMLCARGFVGRENYCTDVELMAAAVLFRMNILCYKADRGKWQLYAHNMSFDQRNDVPTLLIELQCSHFTVVMDVEPFESTQPEDEQGTVNSGMEMAPKKTKVRYTSRLDNELPSTELHERKVDTIFKESSEIGGYKSEAAEHKLERCQTVAATAISKMPCSPKTEFREPMQRKDDQNTLNSDMKVPQEDTTVCGDVGVKEELTGTEMSKGNGTTRPIREAESRGANSEGASQHVENSPAPSAVLESIKEPGKILLGDAENVSRSDEQPDGQVRDATVVSGNEENRSAPAVPSGQNAHHWYSFEALFGRLIRAIQRLQFIFGPFPDNTRQTPSCLKCLQGEANSSEYMPAGVSQRWDSVTRFFVPPDESWMNAKCVELGISQDVERPAYGYRKQFDGLSSQPCKLRPIKGDGHGGFRCISVMLTGSQDHFSIIRQRVAEFVVKHASEGWLRPHLPFPFNASSYLDHMWCIDELVRRENYCTDVELMAAAVLFKMNILCYMADRGKWQLYAHNTSFDQATDVPTLLIELQYAHFTVVTDVEPLKPMQRKDGENPLNSDKKMLRKATKVYDGTGIKEELTNRQQSKSNAAKRPVEEIETHGAVGEGVEQHFQDLQPLTAVVKSKQESGKILLGDSEDVSWGDDQHERQAERGKPSAEQKPVASTGPEEQPPGLENTCTVPRPDTGVDNSSTFIDMRF